MKKQYPNQTTWNQRNLPLRDAVEQLALWFVQILLSFATIWLSFRNGNFSEYSNFFLATKTLKFSSTAAIYLRTVYSTACVSTSGVKVTGDVRCVIFRILPPTGFASKTRIEYMQRPRKCTGPAYKCYSAEFAQKFRCSALWYKQPSVFVSFSWAIAGYSETGWTSSKRAGLVLHTISQSHSRPERRAKSPVDLVDRVQDCCAVLAIVTSYTTLTCRAGAAWRRSYVIHSGPDFDKV